MTNASGEVTGTWTAGYVIVTGTLSVTHGSIVTTTVIALKAGTPYTIASLWTDDSVLTVGGSTFVNATVEDQFHNPVANGTLVTFTTDLGSVLSPRTTTGGFVYSQLSSTKAGTAHITVTSGTAQPRITTVIFNPDVPYSVTLQAKPVTPTVGTNSVLTATVFDQYHNVVSDVVTITFNSSSDSSHVSPPVVTTTNGVATSLISDTLAGTKFITATSEPPALAGTATVTFTPGTPTTITVRLDSINLVAKSNTTTTVTAQVTDIYSNPVPGVTLTGTLPYTLGTVTGPGTTNTNGQAFGVWTAGPTTTVGSGPLNVTNGAITGTTTATLIFTAAQTVTVQVAQPVLFARSNVTSVITVTVTDRLGNPIAGAALSSDLATELGAVAPFSQTNANGQSFSTWTASLASDPGSGLLRVTATSSVSGTAPVTLTADVPIHHDVGS